jgi:hypothetical protein
MFIALVATAIGLVAVLWSVSIRKPVHRMADYEAAPVDLAEAQQRSEWTRIANGR